MINQGLENGVKNVGGSSNNSNAGVLTPRDISGSTPDVDRKD